ncbi:MAG: hypothetical protein FWF78_03385 [Defluviitaleaceae bacterium]|nr:hypothetical protein [Defluviitaleaceae bacterium]
MQAYEFYAKPENGTIAIPEKYRNLNNELKHFKAAVKQHGSPMELLYKLKWAQLEANINLKGKKILDFGSGFGNTANYLAKHNDVTAI